MEPPTVAAAGGGALKPPKGRRVSVRNSALGWLLLSLSCTLANVLVGHSRANPLRRWERRHYEDNHLPPKRARRRRRRSRDAKEMDLDGAGNAHRKDGVDGGYLTNILRGIAPFPAQRQRLQYRPGSLKMPPAEALQYCHVDTTRYRNHLNPSPAVLVSYSRRHKLIYRNVPKSASSSARYAMENYFRGEDVRMLVDKLRHDVHTRNRTVVSFVRDPLDRFYSSYEEAFYRMGPWMGLVGRRKPMLAKWYHKTKHRMDRYPYLYQNMTTLDDYQSFYCPEEMRKGSPKECNKVKTIDDGALAGRFEQFVRDYDGLDPFDIHLNLQTTNLVDGRTGEPLPIAVLYNASEAETGWRDIRQARRKGAGVNRRDSA